MTPADYVGMISFPAPGVRLDPTRDRKALDEAIDRSGGRLYMRSDAMQLGKDAQMAGILLYTLHLNTAFLDAFSPDAPSSQQTAMREASIYARGLDMFNGNAGGTFFEVSPHLIQVKVNQKDSSVRNRASVVIPKRGT